MINRTDEVNELSLHQLISTPGMYWYEDCDGIPQQNYGSSPLYIKLYEYHSIWV